MPNLDYHLQAFYNPTTTPDQKQNLIPEFSALLYKHAITAIQKHAATHAAAGNIMDGFMQGYWAQEQADQRQDSILFRAILSTKETDKPNLGYYKDLTESKVQFTEAQYQGFALVCLENCGATEIVNPYSNPYFYGTAFVDNLWTVTTNSIPFIPAPIINNTVYVELVKKYYQPELYSVYSNSKFDFADEFTPPYFRLARRTMLQFEALRLFDKLVIEVSELFIPEARESIRIRVYYATVARYMLPGLLNLEEWLQQLANSAPADPGMVRQYQNFLDKVTDSVDACIANIQLYINNLDINPGWRFEQPINLPHAVSDKQLVIDNSFRTVKAIKQKLWRAQELLNIYAGKPDAGLINKKIILPPLTPIKTSGIRWLITFRLDEFEDSLNDAINNKSIRDEILARLNNTIKSNGTVVQILSDEQLLKIYKYVLILLRDPLGRQELLELRWQLDAAGLPTYSHLITRKTADGKLRDALLIRTIGLSISKNGLKLSLCPNRKNFDAKTVLHKFKGIEATVTRQFDISPYHPDRLEAFQASKVVDLASNDNQEGLDGSIKRLHQSVGIARRMGHFVIMCNLTYEHRKLGLGYRVAARLTEEWAISTFYRFAEFELVKDDRLLINDVAYKQAKNSGDPHEIARVKYSIILRLISDLLNDLVKLHEELKVVHNDLKPDNILIYIDADGKLRARLADFGISQYMDIIQTSDCQPATTYYAASPQVVGFTVLTTKKLIYPDLFKVFKEKRASGGYKYTSFGRELLYAHWNELKNQNEYANMKPDYKDDCFSLGVTLFNFLTSRYPTNTDVYTGRAFGEFKYMQTQQAYKQWPQFKELLEGLFVLDRDQRFSARDALNAFNRINEASLVATSRPALIV